MFIPLLPRRQLSPQNTVYPLLREVGLSNRPGQLDRSTVFTYFMSSLFISILFHRTFAGLISYFILAVPMRKSWGQH